MGDTFKYISEDKKTYKIKLKIIEKDELKKLVLSFINETESNHSYSSNYQINDLNEKFGKTIRFKTINDFKNCLEENIKKKLMVLKSPYKNVINSEWKTFPNDTQKENTFTLILSKSFNKNISLIFYSSFSKSNKIVEEYEKQFNLILKDKIIQDNYIKFIYEENLFINNLFFFPTKYDEEEKKLSVYYKIIEEIQKDMEFRKILIFFNEDNMIDSLMKVINKFYKDQIFIIIFTASKRNELTLEIESKINKISDTKKSYFDMNNIFIYDDETYDYKNSTLSILKVYSYFNQLGDGFFKNFQELGFKFNISHDQLKYLFFTHYFNILLCGRTGTGKSTFINKFMGEKKAFTLKSKSTGTYRNNYYVHHKYPIRLIDVCGFAEGTEGEENREKLSLIYNKDSKHIIIDEPMNDVFSFYSDIRNNIHLLLYFTVYNDKYDVFPGEKPVMLEALKLKIPIIFIVNKCEDKIFNDEDEMEDLKNDIKEARKGTEFEEFDTIFINCITRKGFDILLNTIYEKYKKNIISDYDLNELKKGSITKENFDQIYKDSFFLKGIEPTDAFLNESLLISVYNIKKLIVELAGYYTGELGFFRTIKYFLGNKIYDDFFKDTGSNFFPLLTDLVKKIFFNFGIEKTYEKCNLFIKHTISKYFDISLEQNKPSKDENEENDESPGKEAPAAYKFNIEKFQRDYITSINLYWNSENNFKLIEKIAESSLRYDNKLEEKILKINEGNKIDGKRLLLLVQKDFGIVNKDNESIEETYNEIIMKKLFYISYTCNELIGLLCGELFQKGFKFKSIYNFYYIVSSSYNSAIEGFTNIKDEMKEKQRELMKYLKKKNKEDDDEEAPPEVRKTGD